MNECALRVPEYFLYGEDFRAEAFGFFHIESFAVRNVPNNWRIGQHRHPDIHQLSVMFEGSCTFEHDGQTCSANGSHCVFTPAKVVHRFEYDPSSVGYVISFSSDFVFGVKLADALAQSLLSRLETARLIYLRQDPTSSSQLQRLVSLIAEIADSQPDYAWEIVSHLFSSCMLLLDRTIKYPGLNSDRIMKEAVGSTTLYYRFKGQLEAELDMTARSGKIDSAFFSVESIAERLSTTPYVLNSVCRNVSGRLPCEIIQTAVLAQATRLLLYTGFSIKEIAYCLGYSHPSHFIRFFKRRRGTTPERFRKKLRSATDDPKTVSCKKDVKYEAQCN